MSRWLTQPGMAGDGEIAVAGKHGLIRIPVTDGVFEWPEEAGPPHSSFVPGSPSPKARDAAKAAQRERLEAEQAALEARLAALESEDGAGVPRITPEPRRAGAKRKS